jgi:hypothetical protein
MAAQEEDTEEEQGHEGKLFQDFSPFVDLYMHATALSQSPSSRSVR